MTVTKVVVLVSRIPKHFSLHFFLFLYDFLGIFEICCFEVHVHFALRTLEVLFLLTVGPWRNSEQGRFGAAVPGAGDGRRLGESGGKGEELESYLLVAVARRERV